MMKELISNMAVREIGIYISLFLLAVCVLVSKKVLNRQHLNLCSSETDMDDKRKRRLTAAEKRFGMLHNSSTSTSNTNANSNESEVNSAVESDEAVAVNAEVDTGESSQVLSGKSRSQNQISSPETAEIAIAIAATAATSAATAIGRKTESLSTTTTQQHNQSQHHNRIASPSSSTKCPALKSTAEHPGLASFHIYQDAIASIYRVYNIGKLQDDIIIPPQPRSERGYVNIDLQITNHTSRDINVYWIDFKGHEIPRGGTFKANGGNWTQTTWIGHPWVFRDAVSNRIMLHFVPYRVIPTTRNAVTVAKDGTVGIHAFSIVSPPRLDARDTYGERDDSPDDYMCGVEDHIFPYPSTKLNTIDDAIKFSISQMEREQISPQILLKYLYKIIQHPDNTKYRQIRTSNGAFWKNVWCNGGRGVLHALGFVENGSYAEMGPPSNANSGGIERGGDGEVSLSLERRRHVSDAIFMLETYIKDINSSNDGDIGGLQQEQPQGADGTGRAGWGY